jgi:aminoglycoside 6-adenylyltransferase
LGEKADGSGIPIYLQRIWWCLNNVAKGLWREEIPYAMDMLNMYLRPMLVRLLGWKAGLEYNFAISVGKSGKYLIRWLLPEMWERFLNTYPRAATEDIWASALEMCDLVDEASVRIAEALGFFTTRKKAAS